jgi:hypothetical protein
MRLFVFLVLSALCGEALIVDYDVKLQGSTLEWFLLGMYKGATPTPAVAIPGTRASVIELNLTATRSDLTSTGHVEVLVFHEEDLAYIGVHGAYQVLLCCDRDVLGAKACEPEQLGYTALASAVPRHPDIFYRLMWFDDSQPVARVAHRYIVPRDGLYYIIFVNCAAEGSSPPRLSGQVSWLNSVGYLAGSTTNLITFGLGLGTAYIVAMCTWILLLWVRRDKVREK